MLNYTPKNDCSGLGSKEAMCVLFLLEGFYSGKGQEELVQEQHELASDESCSTCSWLAALAKSGQHIAFFVK